MIVRLTDTSSAEIIATLARNRRHVSAASGLVLTLLIATDESHYDDTLTTLVEAAMEHPSRIVIVMSDPAQSELLNATIRTGEGYPSEVISLRIGAELCDHTDSVVVPLLLPDCPVVTWWAHRAPADLHHSTLGALSTRRIADSTTANDPVADLIERGRHYEPGDSDLAWTKLTIWRSLLANSLDQLPYPVTSATIASGSANASAELLRAWLELCLQIPVEIAASDGPGITRVTMVTEGGKIEISRTDGRTASYRVGDQPIRTVAMKRRDITDMLAEELRHLDDDPLYTEVITALLSRSDYDAADPSLR